MKITNDKYSSENPNPIDKHIGRRIRLRRTLLGYSQEKLADGLGITFQQIQKYENATNRVGGSRLWDISKLLGVNVGFFYIGLQEDSSNRSYDADLANAEVIDYIPEDIMNQSSTKKLIRNYNLIKDNKTQLSVYELIRSISRQED